MNLWSATYIVYVVLPLFRKNFILWLVLRKKSNYGKSGTLFGKFIFFELRNHTLK